jgi:urea carboxylase
MEKKRGLSLPNKVDQPGRISDAIADFIPENNGQPRVIYRMAGDSYILVEYGEMILDLNLRVRIHFLEMDLRKQGPEGLLELVPGVRSLLIKYDGLQLPLKKLISLLKKTERGIPSIEEATIPSRIIYLPYAFHDQWTREAMVRYSRSVRAEAPYLPDNVEFVARCNNLEAVSKVDDYLQASQHMVIGLGDVYLGAPCAVPLDPRYRLVVPKYNPARMYTPEGAIGIGGAYICIYPMESPGGYQLVGRTLPIWNTWQSSGPFKEAPWLLRNFDRIQFESVSEEELINARDAMLNDKYELRIENGTFSIKSYNEFLKSIKEEVEVFKSIQKERTDFWTKGY